MNDKEIIDQLRSTVFKLMEENKKYEKVIDIMRTKDVHINILYCTENCRTYNSLMDYEEDKLIESEYKLLKEVFVYE